MNDTITVKPLTATSITVAELAAPRDFARVSHADKSVYARRNDALGSLNPTYLRIRHGSTKAVKTATVVLEQHVTRVDAQGNPVASLFDQVQFIGNIPPGLTEQEFVDHSMNLFGALIGDGTCSVLRALYRGEV